ncbi:Tim44 domain-containing protein [Roseateles sp. P5_E11]
MNRIFAVTLATLLAVTLPAHDAEAKRLSSGGLKRSVPTQTAPQTPPAQQPAPQQAAPGKQAAATPAAAPAAAPKRSWLGPIAGLAAGLGLAALASHFGFGGELASIMTMVLLGLVAVFVIRFLVRRFAAPKPQLAGANGANFRAAEPAWNSAAATVSGAAAAPADFDAAGFEKLAKQVFIRLQAANDAGDQADLRRFTTPQMYANIQHDLLERGAQAQRTEVLQLEANVVDVATETGEQIVSVRFSGLVREKSEQAAEDFDEIWHLVKAGDGWLIAGIQQTA